MKKDNQKNDKHEKFFKKINRIGDKKFKIKGTDFIIEKLPPMRGFEMAEQIRVNLTESADKFKIDPTANAETQSIALFVKAILGLEAGFIDDLREELFKYIQFKGKDTGTDKEWRKLEGLEDSAFINFEVVHIYEVLWRALYVNFSGSFLEIASAFPGAGQILRQLSPKG